MDGTAHGFTVDWAPWLTAQYQRALREDAASNARKPGHDWYSIMVAIRRSTYGESTVLITWRGTDNDGGDNGPFTREVAKGFDARKLLGNIEFYVNLELVSIREG